MELKKRLFYPVLILLLACLSLYTIYSIHLDYPLPFHSDEWDHLAITNEILRQNKAVHYNPYSLQKIPDVHWELLYHLFLASVAKTTGLNAIQMALILPTLIGILSGLFVFLLIQYLFQDKWIALFSAVMVYLFKSNITLLGPWFLAPMALGLALIPLNLMLFLKSLDSQKYFLLFALVFLFTTLMHPPSSIIFLPVFALYFLFNPKAFWKYKGKIFLAIIGFALIDCWMLKLSPLDFVLKFPEVIAQTIQVITFYDTEVFKALYSFPHFLGEALFALMLVGIIFALYTKKKKGRILILFLAGIVPFIVQFYWLKWNYLAPYRRMVAAFVFMSLILAGIGLGALIKYIRDSTAKNFPRQKKLVSQAILALAVIFIIVEFLFTPFQYADGLYHNLEVKNLQAVEWLKNNSQENDVVMALPWTSKALHVLTGRKVVGTNLARLGSPNYIAMDQEDFFRVSCQQKQDLLERYQATKVFSLDSLNCPFLKEVFVDKGGYVYEIQ